MDSKGNAGKKVLVVEDEPAITRIFQRVLAAEGFAVEIATNGTAARDRLEQNGYDLLFFDIRTPGISGKELYIWLQEYKPEEAKKVIFSTGDVMSGDTHEFIEGTGRLYLPKPFSPQELRAVTGKFMELRTDER